MIASIHTTLSCWVLSRSTGPARTSCPNTMVRKSTAFVYGSCVLMKVTLLSARSIQLAVAPHKSGQEHTIFNTLLLCCHAETQSLLTTMSSCCRTYCPGLTQLVDVFDLTYSKHAAAGSNSQQADSCVTVCVTLRALTSCLWKAISAHADVNCCLHGLQQQNQSQQAWIWPPYRTSCMQAMLPSCAALKNHAVQYLLTSNCGNRTAHS